jgi:hypothetical protein
MKKMTSTKVLVDMAGRPLVIDAIEALINAFAGTATDREEKFCEHVIQTMLFFDPQLVFQQRADWLAQYQAGKLVLGVRHGRQTQAAYFEGLDLKAARGRWSKAAPRTDVFDWCGLFCDVDNNSAVRAAIKKYTGLKVSQGQGNDLHFYTITHIWGRTNHPACHAALWNISLTPDCFRKLTDMEETESAIISDTSRRVARQLLKLVRAVTYLLYEPYLRWANEQVPFLQPNEVKSGFPGPALVSISKPEAGTLSAAKSLFEEGKISVIGQQKP